MHGVAKPLGCSHGSFLVVQPRCLTYPLLNHKPPTKLRGFKESSFHYPQLYGTECGGSVKKASLCSTWCWLGRPTGGCWGWLWAGRLCSPPRSLPPAGQPGCVYIQLGSESESETASPFGPITQSHCSVFKGVQTRAKFHL